MRIHHQGKSNIFLRRELHDILHGNYMVTGWYSNNNIKTDYSILLYYYDRMIAIHLGAIKFFYCLCMTHARHVYKYYNIIIYTFIEKHKMQVE